MTVRAEVEAGWAGSRSTGRPRTAWTRQNLTASRRAHQVLGRFADEAPLFLAAITRVVNDGLERPLDDALDRDLDELSELYASEDAREGMTAALERRPPRFTGR